MGSAADDLSPSPTASSEHAPWPPVRGADAALESVRDRGRAPSPRARRQRAEARAARRAPSTERRYRQTIPRSTSGRCSRSRSASTSALAVVIVALVALWVIGDAAGVDQQRREFVGDLLQTKDFTFLVVRDPARRAARRPRCSSCSLIVITVLAAAFYNLFAELFGGIEVTVVEHEDDRADRLEARRAAGYARSPLRGYSSVG